MHGVAESRTRLSHYSLPLGLALGSPIFPSGCEGKLGVALEGQENPLEKEMATHSSILAWEIPWTEEPGRLQFMEL